MSSLAVNLTITVVNPLSVTSGTPPTAYVGQAYSHQLTVDGGVAPYTFTENAFPTGWSCSPTGLIQGTPADTNPIALSVTIADAQG